MIRLIVKVSALRLTAGILPVIALLFAGCARNAKPQMEAEEEAMARTEFTERIENFFEYEPLRAGKPSQFLIHLTDLADGSPVEKAEVILIARGKGSGSTIEQVTARVGKVTGIYVADLTLAQAGDYDIEFRVRNQKLDERMPLTDFRVE